MNSSIAYLQEAVAILWRDRVLVEAQHTAGAHASAAIVWSAGFLLHQDDTSVVLVRDRVGPDIRGELSIPRQAIVAWYDLRFGGVRSI